MENSTIVAIIGSGFGVLASIIAGFFAYRSKKDELLYKERQERISAQATSAKEQSIATAASSETAFKAMQATMDTLRQSVDAAHIRATEADVKASAAVEHAHKCDKQLAFLQAVAQLKGWPMDASAAAEHATSDAAPAPADC